MQGEVLIQGTVASGKVTVVSTGRFRRWRVFLPAVGVWIDGRQEMVCL